MSEQCNDPFSPLADPYPPAPRLPMRAAADAPAPCACGGRGGPSLSRRQALLGMGALAALPVASAAAPFPVPCVQERQRITPCRHRYCRHYAGEGDYHGR